MMPATIFLQQSGKRLFLLPGEEETPSVTIDLRARKAYPHPSKLFDEHSRLGSPGRTRTCNPRLRRKYPMPLSHLNQGTGKVVKIARVERSVSKRVAKS